jgi:Asp-tRNA(Asn)/Glu-tRNA(Gln) amidotransferase B subunit
MVETGLTARQVVEAEGLAMVSDASELEATVRAVVEENPKPLADVARNPRAAMKYIGLVREATGGRADVKAVKDILRAVIKERTGQDVET